MSQPAQLYEFNEHGVCTNPKIAVKFGNASGSAHIYIKICEAEGKFGFGYAAQTKNSGVSTAAMMLSTYDSEKAAVSAAMESLLRH